MGSIIPQYVINKVKQNYIEATNHQLYNDKRGMQNPFE